MPNVKYVNGSLDSNLNGTTFNNIPSQTLFTFGSFSVSSNFNNNTIDYSKTLNSFSIPITLDSIGITSDQSDLMLNTSIQAVLNLDKSDINTYVRFGSAYEFFRMCVQDIILAYPGSLFINSQAILGGNVTVNNFVYDPLMNTSTFEIPSQYANNPFTLIYNMGNTSIPNGNVLQNLNLSYGNYIIWSTYAPDNNSCTIIGFTGVTNSNTTIYIETEGNPFPFLVNTTQGKFDYHIKPNNKIFEEFRANLSDYEKYILSVRDNNNGFRFTIKDPTLLDDGTIMFASRSLLWSTIDGYNVDISTPIYQTFLESLLSIGNKYDAIKTQLIARFLSPTSIKVYDLTEEGKMTKLLNIYGREFDQIRQFIDSLAYVNTVTYNKVNNVPDQLVSNLAKTFGWNYFNLVNEDEFMTSLLTVDDTERNLLTDLLPAEINIELWRRILINTNYFWKSKGTRDAIKAMFLMIGIPEPFINITEYVYTVDGKINPNNITLTAADFPSNSLPYDNSGYPKAPLETNDFYFQVSGDTDSGQAYMNAFRQAGFNLILTPDNKKSWVQTGATTRVDEYSASYYQEDSKLVLNTKEIDISLDAAQAVEWDVWNYVKSIDYPANSSNYISPFSFINISIGLTGLTQNTFSLPGNYNSTVGDLEIRFNGILLSAPKTGITTTNINADYLISGNNFILSNGITAKKSNSDRDVIEATFVYSGGTVTGATIRYIVTRVKANLAGTIIPLPSNISGDIQITINGVALTKGTNQFIADYTIDPNNSSNIIVQNPDLISFLAIQPQVQVAYLTVSGSSAIAARSEVIRIDSFNTGKIYYNVSANRYVYKLYYQLKNTSDVKILIDGIALEPETDYSLNSNNSYEIFLPNGLRYGSVISAYYIVGYQEYQTPIINNIFNLGDISNLSFIEFVALIQSRLINATNRKTITDFKGGWYPTLLYIYITYLKRGNLLPSNPLYSNGYTFENLYPFLSKYSAYFQRFVEELLPATIIVRSDGLAIRNTIFTKQKFPYKRGVYMGHINHLGLNIDATTYNIDNNLFYFGDDGSTFYKRQQSNDINWSNDYVCTNNICNLNVNNITVEYPITTTTTTMTPFCTEINLNSVGYQEIISNLTQLGQYNNNNTTFVLIPPLPIGYEIITKINFTTTLSVSGNTNTDGNSYANIIVSKNNNTIFTTSFTQVGYNTGITYTASTIVNIANGDIIKVILENQTIENITNGLTNWKIQSNTYFEPEIISGCITSIIPASINNSAESVNFGISPCSVFLIDNNKNLYSYEPSTDNLTNLFTLPVSSPDVASTATKLWAIGTNQFLEYNIVLNPFSINYNRAINFTHNPGNGLCAKDNTTLIGTTGNAVYLYDITTGTANEILLFNMELNRLTVGDILYNGNNDTYIISNLDTSTNIYHLTQYQSNGTVITDTVINESNINSLYQYDADLFGIRSIPNSEIYILTNTGFNLFTTFNGINILGASQDVSCINYNLPDVLCDDCYVGYTPTSDGRCVKVTNVDATPPTDQQISVSEIYPQYSWYGTIIFGEGYNLNGTTTGTTTGVTTSFWKNIHEDTINGPLNRTGLWAANTTDDQIVGYSYCLDVLETKQYYVGIACDNFATICVDGTNIIVQDPTALAAQFGSGLAVTYRYWFIYPITLTAGSHLIEITGYNINLRAALGAEIYNATAAELISANSYTDLGSKLLFSTKDVIGTNIQVGNHGYGWTCPSGYVLVTCDGPPYCTKIEYLDCGATP